MNDSDKNTASNKQNNGNNKGNKKRHKSLTDINEEQILNYVQKEFIKAYMGAYSQRNITDKELTMFTK